MAKYVTKPQMNLLIRLNGGTRVKLEEVHTITLASGTRKGIIKPAAKEVKLTSLGKEAYEWEHRRRYAAWKNDLAKARDMKRRAAR